MRIASTPHHDGSERYLSDPNPELGETTTAWIRVPNDRAISEVHIRMVLDAEPVRQPAELDHRTETESWWRVDLNAHNPITSYRFLLRSGDQTSSLNGAGEHDWDVPDAQDFRLTTEHRPPSWVRETVWYQIFPDRFSRRPDGEFEAALPDWATARSWDDPIRPSLDVAMGDLWGGSLNGVTARLDHLEALGVNGIYLCPFAPARSNHRYDATAFDVVDPLLGGGEALQRLSREATDRGMRVIGDLTTNHSGNHHDWFIEAQGNSSAETRSYYSFRPDGTYETWLGVPELPKFDHSSAALRSRLYDGPASIAGRYLTDEFGLSAIRVDAANMTARLRGIDYNRTCAAALRSTIDAVRPDAWLLAEHGHDASSDLDGAGWHGTMNYAGFTRPVWTWLRRDDVPVSAFGESGSLPRRSGHQVTRSAREFQALIPYSVALTNMNLLGSHDNARWAYASGSLEINEVGLAMLFAWPGSPSIFYGDEIGLAPTASWDVTTRQPFPWDDQSSWNRQLHTTYRDLISLRTSSPALSVGGMRWVDIGDDHLIWIRESVNEAVLVHVSRRSHGPIDIDLASFGYREASVTAGANLAATGSSLRFAPEGPSWSFVTLE